MHGFPNGGKSQKTTTADSGYVIRHVTETSRRKFFAVNMGRYAYGSSPQFSPAVTASGPFCPYASSLARFNPQRIQKIRLRLKRARILA
ncbi:hypothetical protein ACFL54_00365 [Planctomycetota bacterium]